MADSHLATLDGLPLCADSPVGWTYLIGTSPHVRDFVVDRAVAQELVRRARVKGSVLVYEVNGEREVVEKLTILGGVRPAARPDQGVVRVADLRWLWPGRRIYRRFNLTRRTGERRRISPGLPVAVQPIRDDVAFAPWSLDGDRRWTAARMLRKVLDQLVLGDERFEIQEPFAARGALVQNLVFDDPGDGGLRRALGYFGGAIECFVDSDGTLVLFDRTDRSDRRLVGLPGGLQTQVRGENDALPSVVGPPLVGMLDRRLERPARVRVLFSRLIELRFDGQDTPSTVSKTERGDLPLDMEMVLPVPDLSLTIPAMGGNPARTVLQGTWVTFPEAIAAWNAAGWPTGRTLSMAQIRLRYVSRSLMALFAPPLLDEEGIYARRIQAVHRHFRQTYRLLRRWRDRLGELLEHRAELLDAETGTHAPAEVYCDYATLLTRRGQEKAITANPKNVAAYVNRFAAGAGESVHDGAIPDMRPASALLEIEDQDQGVVRLAFVNEQQIGEKETFFSAVEQNSIASADPSKPVLFASLAKLSDDHEVSVVLSTVAVAPNDKRALHEEVITPKDVEAFGGIQLGDCQGPEITLRVPPMNLRAVARFAWDDARASDIRLAFGFRDDDPGDLQKAFGEPLNPNDLRTLAVAFAARHYLRLIDHVGGQLTTGWTPGLRPAGAAGPVALTIGPDGTAITTVDFLEELPAPDPFSLLPDHLRQVVLGEVMP